MPIVVAHRLLLLIEVTRVEEGLTMGRVLVHRSFDLVDDQRLVRLRLLVIACAWRFDGALVSELTLSVLVCVLVFRVYVLALRPCVGLGERLSLHLYHAFH